MRESIYLPIGKYLNNLDVSSITLSYEQVENILGFKLVPTAHKREQWWENDKKSKSRHCRSWMDVGWRTGEKKLGESITFYRNQ
jgi:hypothetical protein